MNFKIDNVDHTDIRMFKNIEIKIQIDVYLPKYLLSYMLHLSTTRINN